MRVETGTGTTTPAPGAPNTDFSAFVKPSTFPWAQTQRVVDAVARLEIARRAWPCAETWVARSSDAGRHAGRGTGSIERCNPGGPSEGP